MHAFQGVGADDDVAQCGAILKDEDCVVAARVFVAVAWLAAVELLVAAVKGAFDHRGAWERHDASNSAWDFEGLGCTEADQGTRTGDDGELHGERVWLSKTSGRNEGERGKRMTLMIGEVLPDI